MASTTICTVFCLAVLVSAISAKAVSDAEERPERSLEALMANRLAGLRKSGINTRSRMDTLTGFGLGRSFNNDYAYYQIPPWMTRPYASSSADISKRNFDQIDAGAFSFNKRNFDPIDVSSFRFAKRNFDKLDRPGFGDFSKRNFDTIDRAGFGDFTR